MRWHVGLRYFCSVQIANAPREFSSLRLHVRAALDERPRPGAKLGPSGAISRGILVLVRGVTCI